MIPAEIVQVTLILVFGLLWIVQKERTREARRDASKAWERVHELEIENASLSGALAERPPVDPPRTSGTQRGAGGVRP